MMNTFRGIHIILHLCKLSNHPSHHRHNLDTIRQYQPRDRRRHRKARRDDQNGDHENENVAYKVETDAEPALVNDGYVVSAIHDVKIVFVDFYEFGLFAVRADGGKTG